MEFAQSLRAGVQKYGSLTEKQLAAAKKCADRDATRAAAKAAPAVAVQFDMGPLVEAFNTAVSNGKKAPRLTISGLVITRAKDTSANPGFLYVKKDQVYMGKINPAGQFFGGRDCTDAVRDDLLALGGNLLEVAMVQGQKTGTCCMCNAELTNALSIELGIGPICRGKWGL